MKLPKLAASAIAVGLVWISTASAQSYTSIVEGEFTGNSNFWQQLLSMIGMA